MFDRWNDITRRKIVQKVVVNKYGIKKNRSEVLGLSPAGVGRTAEQIWKLNTFLNKTMTRLTLKQGSKFSEPQRDPYSLILNSNPRAQHIAVDERKINYLLCTLRPDSSISLCQYTPGARQAAERFARLFKVYPRRAIKGLCPGKLIPGFLVLSQKWHSLNNFLPNKLPQNRYYLPDHSHSLRNWPITKIEGTFAHRRNRQRRPWRRMFRAAQ